MLSDVLDKCAENFHTGCEKGVYWIFGMFNKIYDDIFDEHFYKSKSTRTNGHTAHQICACV